MWASSTTICRNAGIVGVFSEAIIYCPAVTIFPIPSMPLNWTAKLKIMVFAVLVAVLKNGRAQVQ